MDIHLQPVENDGTGSPILDDIGACFSLPTGGAPTLFIVAPPDGSSFRMRLGNEVSRAAFEREIPADLPAATLFQAPRLFLNTGPTIAAVAYGCAKM
ncbi:MAG: hypothetical protein ACK47C_19245 [Paracoccaceae bacterium]|jgi:hypothetical protein